MLNREIDEELQFHIDEKTRDNIAAGMTAADARQDAVRRFGSRAAIREEAHDANVLTQVETVCRDVAYALRNLRRQRAFACAAILTLALGIGATTAIFTVVYGVLLRPLPFPDPDQVMVVSYQTPGGGFWRELGVADSHYVALREADRSFESIATFGSAPATLTGVGDAVRLPAATVTPDFFHVLRTNAAIGRVFVAADAQDGGDRVVAIGDALWRSRFGADPAVVGRRISLDGVPHTVVGVLPAGFSYPEQSALWTPLAVRLSARLSYSRPVIARLEPGTTRAQAQSAWEAFTSNLPQQPGETRKRVARVTPLKDAMVGKVRTPLLVFAGAVALVLLIACANVSNLLMISTLARRQEIATRLALGAGRGRVVRQLLTETAVIALLGGLAGSLIAFVSVPALVSLAPAGLIPPDRDIQIDGWVLAFTFGVALISGVGLGLAPALHGTQRGLPATGRDTATWSTRRADWLQHTFVVGEVALALVLLVGAGLLVKSFARLTSVDMGFQPSHVMTMTVSFPESAYPSAPLLQRQHQRILESIKTLPGVTAAGAVNWLPLGNGLIAGDVYLRDARPVPPNYRVTKAVHHPWLFFDDDHWCVAGPGFHRCGYRRGARRRDRDRFGRAAALARRRGGGATAFGEGSSGRRGLVDRCRRGAGRAADRRQGRPGGGRISAVPASDQRVLSQLHGLCRADRRRTGTDRGGDAHHAQWRRSQPRAAVDGIDGIARRRHDRRTALPDAPARRLFDAGAGARGDRRLRSAGRIGGPAAP